MKKKFQAVITYSPAHAQVMKAGGITIEGEEILVGSQPNFVFLQVTDTHNGVKRVTSQLLNSVTIASVTVIEEEKVLLSVQ